MKYAPGTSGNYNGRPLGSKNKRTQLATLLESKAEDLINKLIELAISGDVKALSICVDRLLPKARHDALNVNLPDNTAEIDIDKLKKQVLDSVLNGIVSIGEASKIINLIDDIFKKCSARELSFEGVTDPIEASRMYQQIMRGVKY